MTTTERPTMPERGTSPWVTGFAWFASILMIILGAFHALMGLVALIDDEFFVKPDVYTFEADLTAWGWIHLIGGIVVVSAGIAILSGRAWARGVGIGLAALSVIANFLWIPYYPIWSIVLIALGVAVIWALTQYEPRRSGP